MHNFASSWPSPKTITYTYSRRRLGSVSPLVILEKSKEFDLGCFLWYVCTVLSLVGNTDVAHIIIHDSREDKLWFRRKFFRIWQVRMRKEELAYENENDGLSSCNSTCVHSDIKCLANVLK